ncbi:hypothetical protein RJG79_08235 [Mycoplasmatota bacterium WC44]
MCKTKTNMLKTTKSLIYLVLLLLLVLLSITTPSEIMHKELFLITVWFILGKGIYMFLCELHFKTKVLEITFTILIFVISICINPEVSQYVNIMLFLLYILSWLLSRSLYPIRVGKVSNKTYIRVGIIDFTWLSLVSITYLGQLIIRDWLPFQSSVKNTLNTPSLDALLSFYQLLFSKIFDSIFLLGGILGICMTIIWADQIWRKSAKGRDYKSTTAASIRMIIAYFIIIGSVSFWMLKPLYDNIILLLQLN